MTQARVEKRRAMKKRQHEREKEREKSNHVAGGEEEVEENKEAIADIKPNNKNKNKNSAKNKNKKNDEAKKEDAVQTSDAHVLNAFFQQTGNLIHAAYIDPVSFLFCDVNLIKCTRIAHTYVLKCFSFYS
jgi:hypothetical protein